MTIDSERRTALARGVLRSGFHLIGFALGQGPILNLLGEGAGALIRAAGIDSAVVKPLADMAADISSKFSTAFVEGSVAKWEKEWFSERGALGDDISKALTVAFEQAVRQLQRDWTPIYNIIKRTDKVAAEISLEPLKMLREDAQKLFLQPQGLGSLFTGDSGDPANNLNPDEASVRRLLYTELHNYFVGHDERLIAFVEGRLPDEWLLRFAEILKDPGEQGTRAWRACQRLWLSSLTESMQAVRQDTSETLDVVRSLQVWTRQWEQRLDATPPTERDPTGDGAMLLALAPVHERLDEIKALTEQTLRNTEEIKVGVGEVRRQVGDVQDTLQQLSAEVRERPLVTIGPDAQVTQIFETQAYNVSGLPNPYLGLRTFTYAERALYAGRENAVRQAAGMLTLPGLQRTLLFVTGASGSGKSSFAQAGVVPALEAYYADRRSSVAHSVIRPSLRPLAALTDALLQLDMPAQELSSQLSAISNRPPDEVGEARGSSQARLQDDFAMFLRQHTPPSQINVIVIDQFEELFTQSDPAQRDAVFSILRSLPPFDALRTHLIATMRSDYLPELFEIGDLYNIAKEGVDLRAMNVDELKQAIMRPLQVARPAGDRRWEPALLERLARDASADAAYLPLLQVTLEEIWASGSLTLDRYGSLTDAVKERAEAIYASSGKQLRTTAEQATIMNIFLDLVEVSLDDDAHRDVRRQRTRHELAAVDLDRARLIDELTEGRLLSTSVHARLEKGVEKQEETVDIVHETLIRNWDRLRDAITQRRQDLQQRVRFEQGVREWLLSGQSDDYMLVGVRLEEARALDRRGDISLRDANARLLLEKSVRRQDAEQQSDLEEQRRRADQASRQARTLRSLLVLVGVLLLVAAGAAIFAQAQSARVQQESDARATAVVEADNERNNAQQEASARATAQADIERQLVVARAQALAANAVAQSTANPGLGLLLAMQAVSTTVLLGEPPVPQALNALHSALEQPLPLLIMRVENSTSPVNTVAYSPDGRFILTANDDSTARVRDATTGEEVYQLQGHSGRVLTAVWSADGSRIATGGIDSSARVWDAATGSQLFRLDTQSHFVRGVAFSPDGKTVATADDDGILTLWDASTGQSLISTGDNYISLQSVEYSPDGRFILTANSRGIAEVWDSSTGAKVQSLNAGDQSLSMAGYSPDGKKIVTAAINGMALVWDASSGRQLFSLKYSDFQAVADVAFSPDGRFLATCGSAGTVIWDSSNGQPVRFMSQEYAQYSIAYSPNGRFIATASNQSTIGPGNHQNDSTVMVWDAASGGELPTMRGHSDRLTTAKYSPDGKLVLTAGDDGTARVWDAATGDELFTLKGHTGNVFAAAWSPDGHTVATGGRDGTVRIWDLTSKQQLLAISIPGATGSPNSASGVFGLTFSPDGRSLVEGNVDGTTLVLDPATGKLIMTLCCHTDTSEGLSYSLDGRMIAGASLDGTVIVWDATTGKTLQTLKDKDGTLIFEKVSWSRDGKLVAASGALDRVIMWEAQTGRQLPSLQDAGVVYDAEFSPRGDFLATAGADKTVKVWDLTNGQVQVRLTGSTGFVNAASWSPDGTLLVAGSDDFSARQYVIDPTALMKLAESRAYRGLTDEEQIIYLLDATSTPTSSQP